MGEEKPASWYDDYYREHGVVTVEPAKNKLLFDWAAELIAAHPGRGILDVGCGGGTLLDSLPKEARPRYVGVDFSEVVIDLAQKQYPGVQFSARNAMSPNFPVNEFSIVVALEFLEHVKDDLAFLERINPGTLIIASVPTFDAPQHVRHFLSVEALSRYRALLDYFRVRTIDSWFCFSGRRK